MSGWWPSAGLMQQGMGQQDQAGGLAQMGRVHRDSGQGLNDLMQMPLAQRMQQAKPLGQMGNFGMPQGQSGLIQQPYSFGMLQRK